MTKRTLLWAGLFAMLWSLPLYTTSAFQSCTDATVTDETQLATAIDSYNQFCGDGQAMTITVDGTITLSALLPTIDNATTAQLTIQGGTLDGANTYRILYIQNGDVTVRTMTLQNSGPSTVNNQIVGAINNRDFVTVAKSTFKSNDVAIFNSSFNGSSIATVTDSVFEENGFYGAGGAIFTSQGMLTVSRSLFRNNFAGLGGAIYGGPLVVDNSTFTANSASNDGGAIYAADLNLTNSTFSGNSASMGGAIIIGGGTSTISNSIMANSTNSDGSPTADCVRFAQLTFSEGLSNIIEMDVEGTSACGTAGEDYISADPQLDVLTTAPNGTQYFPLLSGSPAIDAGDNDAVEDATDQTGNLRILQGTVDLGAYEFDSIGADRYDPVDDNLITPADAVYIINRVGGNDLTADVNGDGVVNAADVQAIISRIGQTLPAS